MLIVSATFLVFPFSNKTLETIKIKSQMLLVYTEDSFNLRLR